MRRQQGIELRSAGLQRLQEQADVVEFLRVRRIIQQIQSLLVGCGFFLRNVFEPQIVVGGIVGEQHAVVERILAAQVVS